MEAARLGVVFDSSVVIEAERQHRTVPQFLWQIRRKVGEMEAALCSITVAELAHGIYRANFAERRERRRAFLDDLKTALPVYPITAKTAELVGRLGANLMASGVAIPFADLLIGACAIERGYAVATLNLRHFEKIPGLELVSL
ncbi:MAG TPA: hypothetical protein DEQ47_18370 [Solibacterales bacterium]|nr:hypothetical protein [Bryobacterales bacterium]